MLDRIDLPQGTLDLLILRTLAQRHPGKGVGRTYSSILQDNGEDVKVVQELLRHSSSKMTLDVYAQALTPTKRAAQRKVQVLADAFPTPFLEKGHPGDLLSRGHHDWPVMSAIRK
jgi:hypothetical protein